MPPRPGLSRREREMMEIVYARGRATAAEVMESLKTPPSYSAVRATLRILEEKGHLRHENDGSRYVYVPTVSRDRARRSAVRDLLRTFFQGSPKEAVVALLDETSAELSPADREELKRLIDDARSQGR